jgi:outer membrane protein, multidrug efflux system
MTSRRWLILIPLVLLAGCKVGPNYKRPQVDTPGSYRGLAPDAAAQTNASIADEKWWTVFDDQQLQALIRKALAQNYDVRIAATRVLQAQAAVGITRADQFPAIYGGASAADLHIPKTKLLNSTTTSSNQLNLSLSWELDFWGKYRRATEAARANLLSTEWGQKAVMWSLVSNLASAYFQLQELDLEMDISKRALASRQESLRLVQVRQRGGRTSLVDVRQSEQLVYAAAVNIPDLERRIEQQENLISILLGDNPESILRGRNLLDTHFAPTVPAGLPSSLLERRPDVQSAEQKMVAANAQIGVAKAAYFPDISLTAIAATQSTALTSLFTGPAGAWAFGGQLAQPIFTAGKLRSNVRLAEAQEQEALLFYQQSIQQAFREVSDSLIGYRKDQEVRAQQELLTAAAQDTVRLANVRYGGGVTSYLEVLDSDTRYLNAQISLAQAQLNERVALVTLYNALGGGWQQ